jgi:hypothetical protein
MTETLVVRRETHIAAPPKPACPMRNNVPVIIEVGPITMAGWPLPPPVAIQIPIPGRNPGPSRRESHREPGGRQRQTLDCWPPEAPRAHEPAISARFDLGLPRCVVSIT